MCMLILLNTIQGDGVGDILSLVWGWSSELLNSIRHVLQMFKMENGPKQYFFACSGIVTISLWLIKDRDLWRSQVWLHTLKCLRVLLGI
jgi:hypothetical protein